MFAYLAELRLVEKLNELDLPMNPCRQHVLDQCREQGACVLSEEEFESAFLFSAAASNQESGGFCLEMIWISAPQRRARSIAAAMALWAPSEPSCATRILRNIAPPPSQIP